MEFNGNTQDSVDQGGQIPDDNLVKIKNEIPNGQNQTGQKKLENEKINTRQHLADGGQILKTRDDRTYVLLDPVEVPDTKIEGSAVSNEETNGQNGEPLENEKKPSAKRLIPGKFKLKKSQLASCSWAKLEEEVKPSTIRSRIEPWLTSLFQSTHLSLLVGSGLTQAAHQIAQNKAAPAMDLIKFNEYDNKINDEVKRTAKETNREEGNFEDQIRVANELIRGLKILGTAEPGFPKEKFDTLKNDLTNGLEGLSHNLLEAERNLVEAEEPKQDKSFRYLVSFLMSFASRVTERERLHLFTTNYDRVIEFAADVAGLRLIDRFVGALSPIFRASRLDVDMHYNPPGIRGEPRYLEGVARFTKLHGSLDWVDTGKAIRKIGLPFGAQAATPYLEVPSLKGADPMNVMIYPNSAKDRETTLYPYVELFRDFAAAICSPNNTLVCYGYSFGDEHINRVIEDMLTIPSTHLVVISYDDPLGRIMSTYNKLGKSDQVTLLLGHHLGDLETLVRDYLPKPAIDFTTIRMTELLEKRLSRKQEDEDRSESPQPPDKTQQGN